MLVIPSIIIPSPTTPTVPSPSPSTLLSLLLYRSIPLSSPIPHKSPDPLPKVIENRSGYSQAKSNYKDIIVSDIIDYILKIINYFFRMIVSYILIGIISTPNILLDGDSLILNIEINLLIQEESLSQKKVFKFGFLIISE